VIHLPYGHLKTWGSLPIRRALAASLEAFALSRAILVVVTGAVAVVRGQSPVDLWNQWDSIWYLGIANHGYHWVAPGHEATHFADASLAFFPLFPLIVHCLEAVGLSTVVAGLLIANVAFFVALVYLYRLAAEEWGVSSSRLAVILVALFPTAFFTFAPYTESLFLLASAATLYHSYQHQSGLAGTWLAVALLTRSTGIILLIPAIVILQPRTTRAWLLLLGPSAAGWLISVAYLARLGIPLSWLLTAQRAWHRGLAFPWDGFVGSVMWLGRHGEKQAVMAADNVFSLAVTIGFLALTVLAWRELTRPLKLYFLGFWLLILLTPQWLDGYYAPFGSVDRYVLALFPLAGWASKRLARRGLRPVLVLSVAGMVVMSALHVSGVWLG
jgi:hypothetical protein